MILSINVSVYVYIASSFIFWSIYNYFFVFFFFQAEDGIRDIGVTGVQTCALPIFRRLAGPACVEHAAVAQALPVRANVVGEDVARLAPALDHVEDSLVRGEGEAVRSEERRAGKECRSRRSPYH